MSRVTYTITPWPSGRLRAQIFVDGHGVEKAYFQTRAEAESWCAARVAELQTVVR